MRHGEQIGDVVQAHVRLPILTHHAGAVEAENHGQLLDRDVVDDAIVGALQERRVDRDHRPDALRGEAPGECRGVRLGDADVEETVGPLLLENAGPGPDGMAAVIATSLGESPASWVIGSPNIVVHWGGPALTGRSSPVTGS